jgi:polygalacturonase
MTILNVTTYGAKGDGVTDDTAAIQAAVNALNPGDTVEVPAGTFMVNALQGNDNFASGGIFLKSNMTLALSSEAILQVIPNSSDHYAVVTVKGCENVNVVGPGLIVGDRDKHLNQAAGAGQWGFGISIWNNCKNIVVQNLTITKCWGDGLTIIDASNVVIDHVVTDSCRRQNMSIISGDSIKITNCTFNNAEFSGLDLEADLATQTISNVLINNCSFSGTVEGPAHIGVGSSVGAYKNIVIENCQFDLKMQPIFAHDNAGNTGTPWWAFLLNRIFYEGLHASSYRFAGYPTSWSCA